MTDTLSDFELVELVRNENSRVAFNEIVKRNKSRIAYTVYGFLGNCDDSEDIGQEVFLRFLNNIKNFNGQLSLGNYLVKIAVNLSLNELRRRKIRKLFSFLVNISFNTIFLNSSKLTSFSKFKFSLVLFN